MTAHAVLQRRGLLRAATVTPDPPDPPPEGLGFPGPGTVGVGVNGHSLTTISSDYTGTASETLTDKRITGWFKPGNNSYASDIQVDKYLDTSLGGSVVDFSSIGPTTVVDTYADEKRRSVQYASTTLQRCDIFGNIDGCYIWGGNFELVESWIHALYRISSDPNQGGGVAHCDCIQIAAGSGHRFTDCRLDALPWKTGYSFDAFGGQTWEALTAAGNTYWGLAGQPAATQIIIIRPGTATNTINDVIIDGCRMVGYTTGHLILVENFDQAGGTTPHPTNIVIRNCVIDWRGLASTRKILGLGIGCSATWTNNVDHTGAPISYIKAITPRNTAGWSSL